MIEANCKKCKYMERIEKYVHCQKFGTIVEPYYCNYFVKKKGREMKSLTIKRR